MCQILLSNELPCDSHPPFQLCHKPATSPPLSSVHLSLNPTVRTSPFLHYMLSPTPAHNTHRCNLSKKTTLFISSSSSLEIFKTHSFIFVKYKRIMLLKASPAISLLNTTGDNPGSLFPSVSSLSNKNPSASPSFRSKTGSGLVACASKGANNKPLTGVVFEPFEEVKKELNLVPNVPQVSLARQKFTDGSEAAINEQINVEYNVSYVYHAMFAYFDRDNVALKGLAKFFKESSIEEREHAEKLMEYQNKRGGKVKLQSILMPLTEFDHTEKGDALYAMELALSLEKLTNEKLLNLHSVAGKNNDVQLVDFVESEFLAEQVGAIKKISEYVAQLRRVGKGHGVWHFDQMLLHGEEIVA